MKRLLLVGLLLLAASVACGTRRIPSTQPSRSPADKELSDIDLSLTLIPAPPLQTGHPVNFRIDLLAKRSVELAFSTSQRFEIVVTSGGKEIWSSSAGKVYAQVVGKETIASGEGLRYGYVWTPTSTGEFAATATITATNRKDLSVEKTLKVK